MSAFLKLRGAGRRSCSSRPSRASASGRYSFLGFRRARTVDPRRYARASHRRDPYAAVADELARYRIAPLEGLPPFAGGAVGLFGYDLVRTVEPTVGEPNPDDDRHARHGADGLRRAGRVRPPRHQVTILANVFVGRRRRSAAYERPRRRSGRAASALAGPVPAARPRPRASRPSSRRTSARRVRRGGRARQGVHLRGRRLPGRARASAGRPTARSTPFSIYRGLRAVNPSPYMYFLDFEDFEIAGASPEPLVKVTGRARRAAADRRHAAARAGCRGPRAGRRAARRREGARRARDAGRPRPQRPRPRLRVRQRRGRRADGRRALLARDAHRLVGVGHAARRTSTPMDALRAALPAGTLSGAPKIRAMEIIDELEPVKRGPYGGAVGYLSYTGDLDTCINIRTVVRQGRRAPTSRPAAASSPTRTPAYETRETEAKAGAVMRRDRAGLRAGGLGMSTRGPGRRQLRLVHLQPRPVPGRAGRRGRGAAQRRRESTSCSSASPTAWSSRPGPARPTTPGCRSSAVRRFAEARHRRCSASASATSRWRRRSAAAWCAASRCTARPPRSSTTAGRSSRASRTRSSVGRYHSLVVDPDGLPDELEVSARGGRRRDGHAPPRAARSRACSSTPSRCSRRSGKRMLRNFLGVQRRMTNRVLTDAIDRARVRARTSAPSEAAARAARDHGGQRRREAEIAALPDRAAHQGRDRARRSPAWPRRCASSRCRCDVPRRPARHRRHRRRARRRSTSRRPRRSSPPGAGCRGRQARQPLGHQPVAARRTCWRRWGRASTSSPSGGRLHRGGRLRLHVRARAPRGHAPRRARCARRSACARSSTSSAR